jgi:tRNA threonylcarbamoyladenosine biosynthesis protein TsaE
MEDPRLHRWRQGIVTRSAEETERAGRELADLLPDGATLLLEGDLGAGKTTLVRGLARALGVEGDITSPTFALLAVHQGERRQLLHVDAYRLARPEDLDHLLLDELARPPFTAVIEWPERIAGREPAGSWRVRIEPGPGDERRLVLVQ